MAYRHVRLAVTLKTILVSIKHAQRQKQGEVKRIYMQIFLTVNLEPGGETITGLFHQIILMFPEKPYVIFQQVTMSNRFYDAINIFQDKLNFFKRSKTISVSTL